MKTISTAVIDSSSVPWREDMMARGFSLTADEPVEDGGQGAGPAPYDFLLMSLGACTAMTLRMYAARKEWALENLRIELELAKNPEGDVRISRLVSSSTALNKEQIDRLLEIADKTPVTKTLLKAAEILTEYREAS
tara:strand:+ start:144 stop:551 length:408 start_codon:yes stop_codon:yes gene_type:complete